jgi:hypothetical protein
MEPWLLFDYGMVANPDYPDRFQVTEGAAIGTVVGVVEPRKPVLHALDYEIVAGNQNNTFVLDNTGTLRVGDNRLLDLTKLSAPEFELVVSLTDPVDASLSESNRVVLVSVEAEYGPPVIVDQPHDVVVPAGTPAVFSVTTIRNNPGGQSGFFRGYSWYFNGSLIKSSLEPSLTLNNVQSSNAGDYVVVATNTFGSVTSRVAVLRVDPAIPRIVLEPQAQPTFVGGSATFSVGAEGSEPFSYQWQFNEGDIPGATNNMLLLTGVNREDAGSYHVIVSNEAGSTESAQALLALAP